MKNVVTRFPRHSVAVAGERFVAGVNSVIFHGYRDAYPYEQYFTIDECPVGQVIDIQIAEAGYSYHNNITAKPPICNVSLNCTKPIDEPARLCNGRRSCRIPQSILISATVCVRQQDGNYIRITYNCLTGIDFRILFSGTLQLHCRVPILS